MLNAIDTVLAREKRWIILLFALAFLLKLIFVLQSRNSLQITSPILDARYYNEMAKDIAAGHFVRKEAFFMGPLYPYTLALLYSVFGKSLMIARLIQIAGGSLTVILTYLIGSRAFRPSVAMLGALLLALYGASTFYEGQMLMMWLGTLLNMLLLFVLLGKSGKAEITSISDENNTLKFILA